MITVTLDSRRAEAALARAAQRVGNLGPLMSAVAMQLERDTQENFRAQGRPKWQALAPATIKARAKRGQWPGKILNIHGGYGLLGSVHSDSGATWASVGAGSARSAAYAAIHQFGGKAGRGRKVTIPARPYLPFTGQGGNATLQPETERRIVSMAERWLRQAAV